MTKFQPTRRGLLAAGAVGLAFPTIMTRRASAGTIDDIRKRGKVIIGIQGDNPPFGFVNASGVQEGFDALIGRRFAQELGVDVEFLPLALASRIPALNTNRVDVLFACMSMLPERAKAIQYSKPYAALYSSLVAPKTTVVKTNEDMGKLVIGVPRSSTQDTQVTQKAPKGTVIRRYEDDATTIQALLSGQVEAIGAIMTYVPRLNEQRPDTFEEKLEFQRLYIGACTRLGEQESNAVVNAFIDKIRGNGELAEAYATWLKIPVPEFPETLEGVPFTAS